MTIESIQQAVLAELEKARALPMKHREDARCAVSHALAQQLVDCMLRQGAFQAALRVDGYELVIRPVVDAQQISSIRQAPARASARAERTLLAA